MERENQTNGAVGGVLKRDRSPLRGVRMRSPGKYVSEITNPLDKKRVWLGTFHTAEEAARVYNEAEQIFSDAVEMQKVADGEASAPELPPPESSSDGGEPKKKPKMLPFDLNLPAPLE